MSGQWHTPEGYKAGDYATDAVLALPWPDPDALHGRLRAFARDCVAHGDMTPTAQQMLHRILEDQ